MISDLRRKGSPLAPLYCHGRKGVEDSADVDARSALNRSRDHRLVHAVLVTTLFVQSLKHFDDAEETTKITCRAINESKFLLCQF